MGTVLRLKNGEKEFIAREQHFSELIRRELGNDAAEYFEKCMGRVQALLDDFISDFDHITDPREYRDEDMPEAREVIKDIITEMRKAAILV